MTKFRLLILLALAATASGCALLSAANQLQGPDLVALVKQENSSGCVVAWVNGAYLGNGGVVRVLTLWGKPPPDPKYCMSITTVPQ